MLRVLKIEVLLFSLMLCDNSQYFFILFLNPRRCVAWLYVHHISRCLRQGLSNPDTRGSEPVRLVDSAAVKLYVTGRSELTQRPAPPPVTARKKKKKRIWL
jgi:hypothetical protein